MKEQLLSVRVGSPIRVLTVDDVTTKLITMANGDQNTKLVIRAREHRVLQAFEISDAFVDRGSRSAQIKGLWFNPEAGVIPAGSTVGRMLTYYGVETVADLIGKRVKAYPDPNDYLVLVACHEDNLPKPKAPAPRAVNNYHSVTV